MAASEGGIATLIMLFFDLEKISKLLNIPSNAPILKINRVGQTYNNVTIELRTSYVHTSDIDYIHSQNSTFGEAI